MFNERKLQLATDFYQFSVGNIYMKNGLQDNVGVFDVFIRKNPFAGGYTVFAGTEQIIEYIENLKFSEEDIRMLHANHPELCDEYLVYLRNFKFSGDIFTVPEGSLVFPQEPLVRVKAPMIQAHILETPILAIVNHETVIATKASRVRQAAQDDIILEFGMRRCHGTEAALFGARAAIIGGCNGTSNVEAEYRFNTVSKGTMSHAYVMNFESEYDAFAAFAADNPDNAILLVDTYNSIESGMPNALKVFRKMRDDGILTGKYGIRLDSGDLAYLSKKCREMFDAEGFDKAIISASSDLDEYLITDLKSQGAAISMWGVGTKMMTAFDCPALGAVYKLSELTDKKGVKHNKIKLSDDPAKITNPGCKKIVRFYDKTTDKAMADLITLEDEKIDDTKPLKIYHPFFSYKQRTLNNFYTKDLLQCIYDKGSLVYEAPSLSELAAFHKKEKESFWAENLRFVNPNEYHVDLSDKLYDIKKELIHKYSKK